VALNSRALVHLKLNEPEAAIADYNSVLAVDPKKASAFYGRGLARNKLGDDAGAAADMDAARAIQPDIADQFAKWGVSGRP
jgi:tetratricopeptide (TPR) repeat protein